MNRKTHWEQVYTTKSPLEVSWYQTEPRLSLELISHTGLPPDSSIIDIGGGASLLVDSLMAKGYSQLAVLDISSSALTHAKHRLGPQSDAIEWIEADITHFTPAHPFDLWHDRAVFHFLTEASDRQKYITTLKRSLRPGGHLIIATFAIGGPEKCSGLPIVQYDADKITRELGADFQLVEEMAEAHITPSQLTQKFTYFRFSKAITSS
jgi:ubiquinone/menaquinone biosynthesis C-methylase UbiE